MFINKYLSNFCVSFRVTIFVFRLKYTGKCIETVYSRTQLSVFVTYRDNRYWSCPRLSYYIFPQLYVVLGWWDYVRKYLRLLKAICGKIAIYSTVKVVGLLSLRKLLLFGKYFPFFFVRMKDNLHIVNQYLIKLYILILVQ